MVNISIGDRVIDPLERVGEVTAVYPEINIAVVGFDSGEYDKVAIDLLSRYREEVPEPERKKDGLLDRIKGRFK